MTNEPLRAPPIGAKGGFTGLNCCCHASGRLLSKRMRWSCQRRAGDVMSRGCAHISRSGRTDFVGRGCQAAPLSRGCAASKYRKNFPNSTWEPLWLCRVSDSSRRPMSSLPSAHLNHGAPTNLERDWGNLNGAPGWKGFSSKFLLRLWRLAK